MTTDVNVMVGHYPFRHLPLADPARMAKTLKEKGVSRAWTGSAEALIHRDIRGVNDRLVEACQTHGAGVLKPFGAVNPKFPGWEDDLKRCVEVHRMPGIRLHPDFHGYNLADPDLAKLLAAANERKLVVVIVGRMEEERVQHPLFHVAPAVFTPLPAALRTLPELRVVVANWRMDPMTESFAPLSRLPNVYFEIAMIEAVGKTKRLAERVGVGRVLFGSHAPVFVWDSAALKLKEADFNAEDETRIRTTNANTLVP